MLHRFSALVALTLASTLVGPMDAQERVQTRILNPPSTLTLAELQAEVGLGEKGSLEVQSTLPPDRRAPAYKKVDLKSGDRILALNGKLTRTINDLSTAYAGLAVGETLELGVQRGERRWIERFPKADPNSLPRVHRVMIEGNPDDMVMFMGLGVIMMRQEDQIRVTNLFPGGTGASSFEEGDVFEALNGKTLSEPAELQKLWQALPIGEKVEFRIRRGSEVKSLTLEKPAGPAGQQRVIRQ